MAVYNLYAQMQMVVALIVVKIRKTVYNKD